MSEYFKTDPIIVGGVGGSGTRIIAEVLKQMGIFMGSDLNKANDNKTIGCEFPNFRDSIQKKGSIKDILFRKKQNLLRWKTINTETIIHRTLRKFEKIMSDDFNEQKEQTLGWGWKIPGNFYIMKQLAKRYPKIKYIHSLRNGLDMAFSKNQNQLNNWGEYYGVDIKNLPVPKASLNYWYNANSKAVMQAKGLLGDRFLLLNFEDFCIDPESGVQKICDFLNIKDINISEISKVVKIQPTSGRYKNNDLSVFDNSDFDKVRELGFEIHV